MRWNVGFHFLSMTYQINVTFGKKVGRSKKCKKTSSMYTVHKAVNHKTTFSCRNCVLHFLRIVIYHDWKELEHEIKRVWSYMKHPVFLFACFHSTALCVNNVSNLVVVLTPSLVKDFTIDENEIGFWNPLRCNNRFDLIVR